MHLLKMISGLIKMKDKKLTQKLEKVADITCFKNILEEMPQGLDTIVGEGGFKLSGGQQQRFGIARTLFKDNSIVSAIL